MEPLVPRITKSTATAAIRARFKTEGELLKRFEISKSQANLWDGERDGLREVVKQLDAGRYDNVILSWTETAPVLYPNADGKHQIENTLQTTFPAKAAEPGTKVMMLVCPPDSPEELLDAILHNLQTSKEVALQYLSSMYIGTGFTIQNQDLYEKKGSEKASITVMPE
jgi:hypothetical protein